MFTSNSEVRTAYRLKTIDVLVDEPVSNTRVRAYKLSYSISESTKRSSFLSLKQYGSDTQLDGSGNIISGSQLPEIDFGYQQADNVFDPPQTWLTNNGGPNGCLTYNASHRFVADFNGDGITDYMWYAGTGWNVALSNGEGFDTPETWLLQYGGPNGCLTYNLGFEYVADFNGDGKADYMWNPGNGWHVALSNGSGFDTPQTWLTKYGGPGGVLTHNLGFQYVADFNGDGKADYMWNPGNGWHVALSNGSGFDTPQTWLTNYGGPGGLRTYNQSYQLIGDFNGDGKADYMWNYSGWHVALSNGNGFDTPQTWLLNSGGPNGCQTYNANYQYVADFNGDGKTDYMWNYNGWNVALSIGDDFDTPQTWLTNYGGPGGLRTYNLGYQYISDFNGDGKADYMWNYSGWHIALSIGDDFDTPQTWLTNYGGPGGLRTYNQSYQLIGDFNGDGKADYMWNYSGWHVAVDPSPIPDLISSIDNSRGGTSAIEYEPSTKYVNTKLPFSLQTVSEITVNDGLGSEYETTYDYGGGLYDAEDRDFRGFSWASKTNPDLTFEKTYFKQEEYNKGRQYQVDFRATATGSLLNKTTFTWGTYTINGECKFVKLNSKYNYVYDTTTVVTKETYTYDNSNGNLLTIVSSDISTNPSGETLTTTKEYENKDTTGWVWRMTEESLTGSVSGTVRKTKYDYETYTGNLISKTFCLNIGAESGPTIDYDCDTYGNLIKETDPRNNYTETIYDTATQTYPVMIKYPKTDAGTVTHNIERSYDYKFGMPSGEKDENGNWTYYSFDAFGRVDQVDFPDGGQTITEYHDDVVPNYIVTKVKENSSSTIDSYVYVDGLGREKQTVTLGEDNKRIRTLNTYDDMGRIYEVAGPYFYGSSFAYSTSLPSNCPKTRTEYDQRGRPVVVESNDTEYGWNTTQFAYNGLSTTITDPDGKQKTEIKDYLGRLIQVIEYNGGSQYNTYYEYNAAGDLTQVKDHYNTLTTIAYDSLGRKTGMTDPDMGTWQYSSYDDNGNLLTQKSSRNIYTYFTYDELNRITQKSYSNGYTTTNYDYDNLSIPNGRGRLYSMSNYYATTIYNAYDEMGRVESLTKTITKDTARTTTYVYDESGKMMQMGYPDGFQAYYEYIPGTGLLERVSGSDLVVYAVFSDYEPTGKIGRVDHENGTNTIYEYDPESTRLTKITTHDPSGQAANDIQRKSYEYSGAGNIETIIDEKDSNKSYTYEYDGLHRLTKEKINGGTNATYTYNAVGNIMSKVVGSNSFTYTYHSTRKHAVSNINMNGTNYAFGYDNCGNMTSGYDFTDPSQVGTRTLYYNAENMPYRIVHVKGGTTNDTRFYYDGEGRRVKKYIVGVGITYYIGSHFEKINGSLVKYIFAGDMRIARINGSEKRIFHKDHLGSSTAITDMNGNEVEISNYMPFGSLRSHSGSYVSDYKFTDQELDDSTGLYDYGARMYDPVIGRFISADIIVQDPFDPQDAEQILLL